MEYIVVLITASHMEEAKRIGDKLVREKVAACINIVSQINSMFWWGKKVTVESESLLIVKTTRNKLEKIINIVKALHSYTVPEIIALPIIDGNEEYLKWIGESVEDKE